MAQKWEYKTLYSRNVSSDASKKGFEDLLNRFGVEEDWELVGMTPMGNDEIDNYPNEMPYIFKRPKED
jgi:hypothetical protein